MSPSFRRKHIKSETTLGEQLKTMRERVRWTIEDAERVTRVRGKYLEALEESRFDDLPEDVYTLGFLRRYAAALGLETQELLRRYRGERLAAQRLGWAKEADREPVLLPHQPLHERRILLSPKLFWVTTSLVMVLAVVGYLWYQVHGFLAAPDLNVVLPAPETVVKSPTIEIQGQTDETASVTINTQPVAIDLEGNFKELVRLEPGVNTIEVAAKNRLNKETKRQIRVLATY